MKHKWTLRTKENQTISEILVIPDSSYFIALCTDELSKNVVKYAICLSQEKYIKILKTDKLKMNDFLNVK